MSQNSSHCPLSFPFAGTVRRSTVREFPQESRIELDRVGIDPDQQAVRYRHLSPSGDRTLEPVVESTLEALVTRPANGRPGTLVTFPHPDQPDRIVGVVLRDDRGEIDGVWVAEEDGGAGGGGEL